MINISMNNNKQWRNFMCIADKQAKLKFLITSKLLPIRRLIDWTFSDLFRQLPDATSRTDVPSWFCYVIEIT